jgi:hypothetical protein
MPSPDSTITYVPREALAYDRLLTPPAPGAPFQLDESYRLAHLPLVNPGHPRVILSAPGKDYDHGVHGRTHSLVLPVPDAVLAGSAGWRSLEDALRRASFSGKVAWEMARRRAGKLHATVCGSLAGGDHAPAIPDAALAALRAVGPFHVRLEGLFSGNVNRGRLYLEAHPEQRNGCNVLHLVQDALGRPLSDLYVVGVHNLMDDLTPDEGAELAAIIRRLRNAPVAEVRVEELWLLSSRDDLVLDSRVERRLQLSLKP